TLRKIPACLKRPWVGTQNLDRAAALFGVLTTGRPVRPVVFRVKSTERAPAGRLVHALSSGRSDGALGRARVRHRGQSPLPCPRGSAPNAAAFVAGCLHR